MEDLILLVTLKLLLKSTLYSVSTGFLRFYELLLLDLSNYLHHDALTRSRHGDNSYQNNDILTVNHIYTKGRHYGQLTLPKHTQQQLNWQV